MLRIRMSDITDAHITVQPHKTVNITGVARMFEWTPVLRAAVDLALTGGRWTSQLLSLTRAHLIRPHPAVNVYLLLSSM
jgi:hypothetical protein